MLGKGGECFELRHVKLLSLSGAAFCRRQTVKEAAVHRLANQDERSPADPGVSHAQRPRHSIVDTGRICNGYMGAATPFVVQVAKPDHEGS
ncbi:hypothetical protein FA341_20035 [Pseudomonas aeruginosa]|nr:hypothetical protein B7W86_04080 [Pseudomonas aeruginosa]EKA29309.1 hypothetical protein PABE173_6635 [Pseudomonas aeruginosa ATCC 25324]EKA50186.1 hypothetical protein PABE177_0838 [Pseudomonas aeruginosa ATCC 700888]ARJ01444.1 hypothetical protein B7W87_04085 [Pseudomonas aeruginosa]ASA19134.1 hypothetical protein CDL16_04610 [Pseudomonas aeruginosa]